MIWVFARSEIDALQKKVAVERAKRDEKSKSVDTSLLRVIDFDVNDNFKLNPTTASYQLTIEVQTDIDYVVLQVHSWYGFSYIASDFFIRISYVWNTNRMTSACDACICRQTFLLTFSNNPTPQRLYLVLQKAT